MRTALLLVPILAICGKVAWAADLRAVDGGEYASPFEDIGAVVVDDFLLETGPVSNAEFLALVREAPKWRRSEIAAVFAEEGYLRHWASDLEPGKEIADEPVTWVSWFAARAYCERAGRRLPTMAEWEWALGDRWTRNPDEILWEWVEDFQGVVTTEDSRASEADRRFYCAAGAIGVSDPADYGAMLRYGLRSSLEADYTLGNLGFRCAGDAKASEGAP